MHALRQKTLCFLAGALFIHALQRFSREATHTSAAATRQPCDCSHSGAEPASDFPKARFASRPISVVTVFGTDDAWIDDPSGRLGFQRGLAGWSKYAYLHGYTFKPFFFVPNHGERLNWNRVQAALDECQDGAPWVMWTESDVWVTNFENASKKCLTSLCKSTQKPRLC